MALLEDLILREYEISKTNIKSIMGQLIAVSGSVIAISIVIFRVVLDIDPHLSRPKSDMLVLIIILMNFLLSFFCFQNVQIFALRKHIASLEILLNQKNIFRWESGIARIWYGNNSISITFIALLILPAITLVLALYASLGIVAGWPNWIWIFFLGNTAYAISLGLCTKSIVNRIGDKISNSQPI